MDIITYALSKKYTDRAIQEIGGSGLHYKGGVTYISDLPTNAEIGDCYTVKYKGTSGAEPWGAEFVYGNYEGVNQWIRLGSDTESTWGNVEGNIDDQKDLKNALDAKVSEDSLNSKVQNALDNDDILVGTASIKNSDGIILVIDGGNAEV